MATKAFRIPEVNPPCTTNAGNAICEGGIVIDLSQMTGVRVDPVKQTARAEPGVLWLDFDIETQAFGLATTGGTNSDTGIAGLTLGGGHGWLGGKYGLTTDNLILNFPDQPDFPEPVSSCAAGTIVRYPERVNCAPIHSIAPLS